MEKPNYKLFFNDLWNFCFLVVFPFALGAFSLVTFGFLLVKYGKWLNQFL